MRWQPIRSLLLPLSLGVGAALTAGLAQVPISLYVLPDEADWRFSYWSASAAILAVFVAIVLQRALGSAGALAIRVALGAIVFALLLTAFVSPVALCFLDEDAQREPRCEEVISFFLMAAPAAGLVFGAFVGLLSWAMRPLGRRGA